MHPLTHTAHISQYCASAAGPKNRAAGERAIEGVVQTVRELLEEAKENRLVDPKVRPCLGPV